MTRLTLLAMKLFDVVLPVTDRDDSVPTEVMFGWALVVTVPAVVALVAVPAVATFKFAT